MNETQPLQITLPADLVKELLESVALGLEHAKETLYVFDSVVGRTTLNNKRLAEMTEQDIKKMQAVLLKAEENGARQAAEVQFVPDQLPKTENHGL